ncbi:MAG: MATE family efflux transporter [Pseudomonadota bacterium]
MAWGVLASMGMVLTDTWFVGQLGTDELAAIGFTIPVVSILFGIGWGFGTSVSSIVGRAIGDGDDRLVKDYTTQSILLAILVAFVFTGIGYATADQVFGLLGAPDHLIPLIRDYMDIWFLGAFAVVVPQVGNAAIRAAGNAKTPGRIMIGIALLNVILDPIFIFGWFGFPRLELQGAALATVVAFAVSFSVSFFTLRFRLNFVTLAAINGAILCNWVKVIGLALPAIGNNLVFPTSAAVATWLLASFGSDAVAGFNVAVRIEAVTMVPVTALTFALASFSGQNFGARDFDRLREAIAVSYRFAWISGIAVALISFVAAWLFVPFFTTDPEAMLAARYALVIVSLSYPLLYVSMLVSAACNGMGNTMPALVISLGRLLVLFVPLALALAAGIGLIGIFIAMAVSNLAIGLGSMSYLRRVLQKHDGETPVGA